jgi:hypothetical protein
MKSTTRFACITSAYSDTSYSKPTQIVHFSAAASGCLVEDCLVDGLNGAFEGINDRTTIVTDIDILQYIIVALMDGCGW